MAEPQRLCPCGCGRALEPRPGEQPSNFRNRKYFSAECWRREPRPVVRPDAGWAALRDYWARFSVAPDYRGHDDPVEVEKSRHPVFVRLPRP